MQPAAIPAPLVQQNGDNNAVVTPAQPDESIKTATPSKIEAKESTGANQATPAQNAAPAQVSAPVTDGNQVQPSITEDRRTPIAAKVEAKETTEIPTVARDAEIAEFHRMVACGALDTIKRWLKLNIPNLVNVEGKDGKTALHHAIDGYLAGTQDATFIRVFEILLEHGADAKVTFQHGDLAISLEKYLVLSSNARMMPYLEAAAKLQARLADRSKDLSAPGYAIMNNYPDQEELKFFLHSAFFGDKESVVQFVKRFPQSVGSISIDPIGSTSIDHPGIDIPQAAAPLALAIKGYIAGQRPTCYEIFDLLLLNGHDAAACAAISVTPGTTKDLSAKETIELILGQQGANHSKKAQRLLELLRNNVAGKQSLANQATPAHDVPAKVSAPVTVGNQVQPSITEDRRTPIAAAIETNGVAEESSALLDTYTWIEGFHSHIAKGDLVMMRSWLDSNIPNAINVKDKDGKAALHCAIDGYFFGIKHERYLEIFAELLRRGADTQVIFQNGDASLTLDQYIENALNFHMVPHQQAAESLYARLKERYNDKLLPGKAIDNRYPDQMDLLLFQNAALQGDKAGVIKFITAFPQSIQSVSTSMPTSTPLALAIQGFMNLGIPTCFEVFDLLLASGHQTKVCAANEGKDVSASEMIEMSLKIHRLMYSEVLALLKENRASKQKPAAADTKAPNSAQPAAAVQEEPAASIAPTPADSPTTTVVQPKVPNDSASQQNLVVQEDKPSEPKKDEELSTLIRKLETAGTPSQDAKEGERSTLTGKLNAVQKQDAATLKPAVTSSSIATEQEKGQKKPLSPAGAAKAKQAEQKTAQKTAQKTVVTSPVSKPAPKGIVQQAKVLLQQTKSGITDLKKEIEKQEKLEALERGKDALEMALFAVMEKDEAARAEDEKIVAEINAEKVKIAQRNLNSAERQTYLHKKKAEKEQADRTRTADYQLKSNVLKAEFFQRQKAAQELHTAMMLSRNASFDRHAATVNEYVAFEKETEKLEAQFAKLQACLLAAYKSVQANLDAEYKKAQARAQRVYTESIAE